MACGSAEYWVRYVTGTPLQKDCPPYVQHLLAIHFVRGFPANLSVPLYFFHSWSNRQDYVDGIRRMRQTELTSEDRMTAIRAGLATIIPLQLLYIMSPLDMEIRTCGLPSVDLNFLKVSLDMGSSFSGVLLLSGYKLV